MFGLRHPLAALPPAVLLCLVLLVQSPAARADVESVEGSATGVVVTGFAGGIPATPTVSVAADETTPPAGLGPFTNTAAGTSLPGFPELFSTGPLAVSTLAGDLAGENHAGFVESRATVLNIRAGAGPILATATSIESRCRASGDGSTGTTTIQGATLDGRPFGNGTPEPNTVIDVPGIGTVTLNEQIRSDVPGKTTIIVNAVHARYEAGPAGILPRDDESAEAVIGQVVCRAVGPNVNMPTTTTTTSPPAAVPTTSPPQAVPTTTPVPVPTAPVRTLPRTGSENHLELAVVALGAAVLLRRLSGKSA